MKVKIDIDDFKEYLQEEVYKTDLSEVMPIIDHYCKCFNEIPNNATNGDMIKALFPKCEAIERDSLSSITIDGSPKIFRNTWWNAPYKAESEGGRMPREEIWSNIEKLSELRSKYSCLDEKEEPFYHALSLGIKGIKALEQEPILDKIRAEIERKAHSGQWSDATMYGMLKAVAIIDKYKAESEDKK